MPSPPRLGLNAMWSVITIMKQVLKFAGKNESSSKSGSMPEGGGGGGERKDSLTLAY